MTVSVFNDPNAVKKARSRSRIRNKMRPVTIREFGGGWNEIDSPVGLSTRYAKVLKNWYRRADGSQAIRYGTQLKTNIADDALARRPHGPFTEADAGTEAFGDAVAAHDSIGMLFESAVTVTAKPVDIWMEITVVTASSTFEARIYSNNAGSPGTLLFTGNSIAITTTGFKTWSFTSVNLTSGTSYWVVITDTAGTGNITGRTVADQGGTIESGHSDTITSIAANQLDSTRDWKMLVNVYRSLQSEGIIDMRYFNGNIISVCNEGEVVATNGDFESEVIFDDGIAASLESAGGWSDDFDMVSFTEIKGSLTIHNGVDKPLEVQEDLDVRYLQDLATGSNVNTPIGKYATTVSDFLCVSGIDDEESVIYIGARGTVGTFVGDPPPNDGVALDVGAFVPEDSNVIRGISSFRNYLFVHFLSGTLQVELGTYDDEDNHIPRVNDTLLKFGLTSHRAVVPVVNDLLFCDPAGVNTVKRNVLSGEVEPDRLSELIAPAYQNQVATLSQSEMLTDIFAVHDRLAGHYMIFVPYEDSDDGYRVFTFTFNERMQIKAWSEFTGWTFNCATSSSLGRVFFAKDTRIYQYGNEAFNEEFSADLVGEYDDTWDNDEDYEVGDRLRDDEDDSVWICLVDHTSALADDFDEDREARPTLWAPYEGENINFDWELPWTDSGSRSRLKRLAFINLDTQGTSKFNVDIFVDNIYLDVEDEYDPALTLEYTGGDSPGYGGGDQPYGGGRRTSDERLWSHPVKYKIAKLRLHGGTKLPLRVVAITMLFAEGRYGR